MMDANLWGLGINNKDHLVLGGCDVVEMAKNYGTPLHLVDARRLRSNYRRFLYAFKNSYGKVKVFYSYKTNCVPGILKELHKEGCGAEVVSPYELWLAFKLGLDPSDVIYNGVNKSKENLKLAVQKGVGIINVDSISEIYKLKEVSDELKKEVDVGIRIPPARGSKSYFGLQANEDKVIDTFRELKRNSLLNLCCLHVHDGTRVKNTEHYRKAIELAFSMIKELKEKLNADIKYLDLGGGFGVPNIKSLTFLEIALYKAFNIVPQEPRAKDCPSIEVFAEVAADSLRRCCTFYGLEEPYLLLEPGRNVTSDSQILLLTVCDIKKRSDGTTFAITDGGQSTAFPLFFEYHKCLLANRATSEPKRKYFIAGPILHGDIIYRNLKLPELKEGDVLAIMDAGAYFTSYSYSFSYPRPAIVLVSDGCHTLIRQQESFEHMTALDKI